MSKKRKLDQHDALSLPDNPQPATNSGADDANTQPQLPKGRGRLRQERSERRSKRPKKSNDQSTGAAHTETADQLEDQELQGDEPNPTFSKPSKKLEHGHAVRHKTSKTPARFIVFVGNLPFDATTTQVQQHFVKLDPTSVRLSTDKKTGKGKGFAFLEFDAYDKMKTCLKLYHHSIFEPKANPSGGYNDADGEAPAAGKKGRRINVELTAGGGGKKSKDRKARIQAKNKKLREERRITRIKDRVKQEQAARKEDGQPVTGVNAVVVGEALKDNLGTIHPSRLSRVRH